MTEVRLAAIGVFALLLGGGWGCARDRFEPDPYDVDFEIPRTESFPPMLSTYALYQEPMAALQPGERTILYELSSELFTDYAAKQRLLRVPDGTRIELAGDGTTEYPEGTMLVKTFYYPTDMRDPGASLQIIETRLLVKTMGRWNVATYVWNAEQTDASLLLAGTTTDISWIDEAGEARATQYVVPHEGECVTCHQTDESVAFIGPTLRNMNRPVQRGGDQLNQLSYFHGEGVVGEVDAIEVASIPNYKDAAESLEGRARAYLDINCAHCHRPGGWNDASRRDLDFRFSTPLEETGLQDQRQALRRLLRDGEMPYLGTTLLHDEGIELVLQFVDGL